MQFAPRDQSGPLKAPIVNPADRYQEKGEALHKYGQYLMSCLPKYIQQFSVWKDELTIYTPPAGIIPVFTFLKYHTAAEYTQVSDITAVDFPTKDQRFEVVYNMLSIRHNSRIRVKTYADEATPVPSICDLYDGANWYEREVYDLFGVFFVGHPDLRRIMTDYGFDGHPLRKDFPMTGYTEIRYDEEKKRIVVEPLEMTQAFRNFRGGSSAWEPVGPGEDMKPEQVRGAFLTVQTVVINLSSVQTTNTKTRTPQGGRAKEIDILDGGKCIYSPIRSICSSSQFLVADVLHSSCIIQPTSMVYLPFRTASNLRRKSIPRLVTATSNLKTKAMNDDRSEYKPISSEG